MGSDKAWLSIDGELVLPSLCERLLTLGRVVVVRRDDRQVLPPLPEGVAVTQDMVPDAGPLGGLVSGMWVDRAEFTFACACDMPWIDIDLVSWMAAYPRGDGDDFAQVLLPIAQGREQPLHALYHTSLPPLLLTKIEDEGARAMHGWYEGVSVHRIPQEEWSLVHPSGASFNNVNTPADLPELH
jgi:molybdopterin-guanine dinucleotide biosynthesis protein A